jgi:endonuclease/exonuclease/phosphatase (EEP) superfamily protein YafD
VARVNSPRRLPSLKRRHSLLAAIAVVYPALLLSLVVLLRYVGERWWVTGIGLYLPRIVLATPLAFIVVALALAGLRRFLWTQVVALLLLLFPLMGFVPPWPASRARSAPTLRVLSYNIDSGNGGADEIVREIDRAAPDVVFLQEVGALEPLTSLLRARFPTVQESNQFVVASRYPVISASDPDKLDYEGRHRSPRFVRQVLDTPLGPVAFYNVHPLSPREIFYSLRGRGFRREILSGRLFSSASSAVFQANNGLRALQVQAFSAAARAESGPVVIVGDTNLPGLSFLLNRYLSEYQDGFSKAGWGFGYTFPTTRGAWMRIDRIFASEELRFVGFDVGKSRASDHGCVVADLQRR